LSKINAMTIEQLQTRVGIGLILAQFSIILLLIVLRFTDAFNHDEMKTSIALIVPMLAIYTTSIVALFVQPSNADAGKEQVQFRAMFVTVFFPVMFVVTISAMIILKAYQIGFKNFEEFKDILAITQTAFAVYLGTVLRALFNIKFDPAPNEDRGPNPNNRGAV
jgi:hypothetical protein